jgi:general secretion pathway protein C
MGNVKLAASYLFVLCVMRGIVADATPPRPHVAPTVIAPRSRPLSLPAPVAPFDVREVAPHVYDVVGCMHATSDELASDELAAEARIVPSFTDGRATGFKLFGIRPHSALSAFGFMNGEVLVGMNGQQLTSPESVLDAYGKVSRANRIFLEVERAGRPLTITLRLDRSFATCWGPRGQT